MTFSLQTQGSRYPLAKPTDMFQVLSCGPTCSYPEFRFQVPGLYVARYQVSHRPAQGLYGRLEWTSPSPTPTNSGSSSNKIQNNLENSLVTSHYILHNNISQPWQLISPRVNKAWCLLRLRVIFCSVSGWCHHIYIWVEKLISELPRRLEVLQTSPNINNVPSTTCALHGVRFRSVLSLQRAWPKTKSRLR